MYTLYNSTSGIEFSSEDLLYLFQFCKIHPGNYEIKNMYDHVICRGVNPQRSEDEIMTMLRDLRSKQPNPSTSSKLVSSTPIEYRIISKKTNDICATIYATSIAFDRLKNQVQFSFFSNIVAYIDLRTHSYFEVKRGAGHDGV